MNNIILEQYDKQKTRGQQGFGIFDGQENNMVHEAHENKILQWLVKYDSNLLLMHHRFPTSTINVKRAAHPFSTKDYFNRGKLKRDKVEYILVHNGTIRNAEKLIEEHYDKGIEYYSVLQDLTFNDSEALLWDFALTMEGKQKEMKAAGGIAFICLKLEAGKLSKMYFARNYSSPLRMLRNKGGIALASELDEGEAVPTDTLFTYNYKLKRLTSRKFDIPGYFVKSNYVGNHSNYPTYLDCNCNEVGWKLCVYHSLYDDWGDGYNKNELKLGEKVGNVLSRQFGGKFAVVDRSDQSQIELPSRTFTSMVDDEEQRRDSEDKLFADNPITPEEITQEYMAYLAAVQGHFESAYWTMEGDYESLETADRTKHNIRQRRLLEYVMERIENDPDYVSESAISSVWEILWKQAS